MLLNKFVGCTYLDYDNLDMWSMVEPTQDIGPTLRTTNHEVIECTMESLAVLPTSDKNEISDSAMDSPAEPVVPVANAVVEPVPTAAVEENSINEFTEGTALDPVPVTIAERGPAISTTSDGDAYNLFCPLPPSEEELCPGDVIFYWHELYVCGNPMGERNATIRDIDPDRDPMLRLETMDPLSWSHRVKRVKVMQPDGTLLTTHNQLGGRLVRSN
jgi:hypothetical protein